MELQFNVSRARISRLDRSKVHLVYASWPRLAEEGARVAVEIPFKEYTRAVYIGMGGSASAGDIILDWLKLRRKPKLKVEKGTFQHSGMRGALVLACSASGNTSETIEGAKSALQRGATLVSICSGGRLEEFARKNGLYEEVDDSLRALRETRTEIEVSTPIGRNPSKRLAASILNSVPKIYGSTVTRGVAFRFKNALNENAKKHDFADAN